MFNKHLLNSLSTSGQGLKGFDDDMIVEVVTVAKMAGISNHDSRFLAFADLDSALQMHKDGNVHSALIDIVYQSNTDLFDIKIDKVGLEIISLTLDDIKQLANMPID
ncbi:MAG: hypothetical protein QG642_729 [Patescibacteria group bacterium]|nr:hypothetical protein [Patescibacteria group bacterium]